MCTSDRHSLRDGIGANRWQVVNAQPRSAYDRTIACEFADEIEHKLLE
jgi:hypothetical protein